MIAHKTTRRESSAKQAADNAPVRGNDLIRGDVEYRCPGEALAALQRRTDRVRRITPRSNDFLLRYRGIDLGDVHVSRTWERSARFEIDGATIPALFFPMQGGTCLSDDQQSQLCDVSSGGSFTVARRAVFETQPRYSELVVVLAPALLRRCLDALEVKAPTDDLLSRAALNRALPGLARLRALALDAFSLSNEPQPDRFVSLYGPLLAESIALTAARILAATQEDPGRRLAGSPAALGRATDYVLDRLTEPLSLEDIAAEAGVTIRRLQTLFRTAHGCSPREFIQQRRLEHAHNLLSRRLVATVTDAALGSGMNHLGRFSAGYASRYGQSPSRTLRGKDEAV